MEKFEILFIDNVQTTKLFLQVIFSFLRCYISAFIYYCDIILSQIDTTFLS